VHPIDAVEAPAALRRVAAGERDPPLVDVLASTIGPRRPDQLRQSIEHLPNLQPHVPSYHATRRSPGILWAMTRSVVPLTDAQRWVLSLGGVLTELNHDRHDALGGSPRLVGSAAAYEVLVNEWDAPTEEALVKQLDRLLATADDDPRLAFVLGRLATIAGLGHVAYLLDANAAWGWLVRAALRAQRRFPSFRAFGEAYLAGRDRPATADQARAAVDRLLVELESPWVRVPYATPLEGARPPRDERRVLRVGRSGDVDAKTIGEALARAQPGDRIVVAAGTYRERLRVSTEAWDALPSGERRKQPAVPRAPSVEIVGEGRVVLTSEDGPVVEVDDGGLLLDGLTIINERRKPGRGQASTAVYVVDGFVRMVGCTLRSRAGVGLTTYGATQLEACKVDRCGTVGVSSQGIMVMRGGEIHRCGAEGVLADDDADAQLFDVRVHGCGEAGVHVTGSGTLLARGCRLERNTSAGALATAGGELMLQGCTVQRTEGSGVRVADDGALEAIDCTIEGSRGTGLEVEATRRIVLRRCRIAGSKAHAVVFRERSAGTLEHCELVGSEAACVELADESWPRFADCSIGGARQGGGVYAHSGAGGRFERCTIEAARFQAVRLDGGATSTFLDCAIRGRGDGVLVHGRSRGKFLRCTIRDAAGPGVRVWERADPQFDRCRIEGSKEANVAIQNAGRGLFVDCVLVGARGAGLEVAARCAPVVRGGSIVESRGPGILVSGGVIDVEGCELARNDVGVRFDGGSGRVVGCAIHHSKVAGVFATAGASPRIEACDVFDNESAGIELEGRRTAPHVVGCDVHDNEHAIHAYGGARGTIESGAIGGGRGYALYVEDGARPTLAGVLVRPGRRGAIFDVQQRATLAECRIGEGKFVLARPPRELDPLLGELTFDDALGGLVSASRPIRFLRGHACRFILEDYADDPTPEEVRAAVRDALDAGPALLKAAQPHVVQYRADMLALSGETAKLAKASDVWSHVRFGDALHVRRRANGDAEDGVYLTLECSCDWEVEHGLQLVLHDGAIARVGPFDGHVTNAGAYADRALIGVVYKRR